MNVNPVFASIPLFVLSLIDVDKTIKDILKTKIRKEHLTNYLKHSYKIYNS